MATGKIEEMAAAAVDQPTAPKERAAVGVDREHRAQDRRLDDALVIGFVGGGRSVDPFRHKSAVVLRLRGVRPAGAALGQLAVGVVGVTKKTHSLSPLSF